MLPPARGGVRGGEGSALAEAGTSGGYFAALPISSLHTTINNVDIESNKRLKKNRAKNHLSAPDKTERTIFPSYNSYKHPS